MAGRHRAGERRRWIRWLIVAAALALLVTGIVEVGGFAWLLGRFL